MVTNTLQYLGRPHEEKYRTSTVLVLFRLGAFGAVGLAETDPPVNSPLSFQPLSRQEKFDYYVRQTFGPQDLMKRSALAGIAQWHNHPPEWEQGLAGYGRRFSSSYGQHAIKKTIQFSIGAALKEDPRYFASAENGFWRRTGHAVAHTMIVRNDHNRRVFSFGRLSGTLGGSFISRTWHPERQQTVGNALRNAGVALSAEASWNVLREFWPEIKPSIQNVRKARAYQLQSLAS